MRLGYGTFIKEKLKTVLKNLAIQICKILRNTKPFVSVGFCLACHSVSFIRFEYSFIFHINAVPRTSWFWDSYILE